MKNLSKTLLITLSLILLSACGTAAKQVAAPMPTIGAAGSKVTIQEFSDFQCPACGEVSPQVEAIARANPGLVRLEFHHFPLSQHENAFNAAVAAECANLQGKFWEMGDIMFSNQHSLTVDKLKEYAKVIGVSSLTFDPCLDGQATSDRVREDLKKGADLGVSYTPSLFVNGKLVQFTTRDEFEGYVKSLK
jgi:protein-disulfide isomerase